MSQTSPHTKGPKTPTYRKRHLFARSLKNVLEQTTNRLTGKRGKIFNVILSNWNDIVGNEMAQYCYFADVKFPSNKASKGVLVVHMPEHKQPELPYISPIILEKCSAYLGYNAIEKMVALPLKPDKK